MDNDARLWDLSPYDLQRQPQTVQENSPKFVQTTGRLLESELRCAICLDILRNTRTTKECLHRFCDECIKQALRNGNKECPNCRKKLVSMRSLRPDPLFDEIIRTVFPNRDEMEQREAALLAKIDVMGNGPSKKRKADGSEKKLPSNVQADATISTQPAIEEEEKVPLEISACMEKFTASLPARQLTDFLKKWKSGNRRVRVAAHGKVIHVAKFILIRILVDNNAPKYAIDNVDAQLGKVQIHLRLSNNELKLLGPNQTLANIRKNTWKSSAPMPFCFSLKSGIELK